MLSNREITEILGALAGGVNPVTGEIEPEDSVLSEPEVIRALFQAIEIVREAEEISEPQDLEPDSAEPLPDRNRRLGRPPRSYQKWTTEEETILVDLLRSEESMRGVTSLLRRSSSAIWLRIRKLGLLTGDEKVRLSAKEAFELAKKRAASWQPISPKGEPAESRKSEP